MDSLPSYFKDVLGLEPQEDLTRLVQDTSTSHELRCCSQLDSNQTQIINTLLMAFQVVETKDLVSNLETSNSYYRLQGYRKQL
jgi:hypothetical protein